MTNQTPEATSIICTNEKGTQFSAEINGHRQYNICEGSTDWKSVEKAIADGAKVEAYIAPPVPSADEVELAQIDSVISREIEDVVSILTVDQQEAFYALTDNAPEGKRKRVAMERKKVLRARR
jgi:hypothetical protein